MKPIFRRAIMGSSLALLTFTCMAQPMPKTTKEIVKGQTTEKSEQLKGTVVFTEGNKLVVRMSSGEIRSFDVPESRRFIVDGKELTVYELKRGTRLTATVTTTTTPITERTTTIGTGKVWWVAGNTVIITLPNNENRQYKVSEAYRFNVDGRPASVHDLRKGMTISAQKIVEEPRTEIASNTVVSGHAPPPEPVRTARSIAEPDASRAAPPQAAAPPPPAVAAPAQVATPAPTRAPAVERAEAKLPAKLPKTASPLPLIGLSGLMVTGASFVLRLLRRA